MCIENIHFKCAKSYYRDLRLEVTHLFLEYIFLSMCVNFQGNVCLEFLGIKSTLAKKNYNIFFFYILGYFYFFSHVTLFSIPKKLLDIVRNKTNKRIMTIG